MAKFYVATPIYYVNDKPHLGHGFTTVAADIIARWHRLKGEDVLFLTGTDEHGEKNAKAAEASGKSPQEYVDRLAQVYKEVWKKLDISYDGFIRTSSREHEAVVARFIGLMEKSGDIYKGTYEGWYCTTDETFLTELQLVDGKCPHCGKDVKKVKEESYFFRLSKYQQKLLDYYEKNPTFLSPSSRSLEIKNRVKDGLKDLSITRKALTWGVPYPSDKNYTVYVWVEALLFYLTGVQWPGKMSEKFWPVDLHLIGKEINWFHTVIWPAMLFSAGLEPPRRVFAHGWWTVDGKKMSKSLGNAIDPVVISDKYSVDAFRYFVIREKPLGDDGDFSEKALVARINGELVADLGNLLSRTVSLAEKFKGEINGKAELEGNLHLEKIDKLIQEEDLTDALEEIWSFIRSANKYVNEKAPWKQEGADLANSLYNLIEACRIISILISPFMPSTSARMNEQLGVKAGMLNDCRFTEFKGKVKKGEYLFRKVE